MNKDEVKAFVGALKASYTDLDYYKFCELLELNPEFSNEYWVAWQGFINGITRFDSDRVTKLINYGLGYR